MNISLGIFDVFANAVPGSLYVLLTLYASVRLGWVDLADVTGLNTTARPATGRPQGVPAGASGRFPLARAG